MPTTKRADLFIPEVLTEAMQGEFAGVQALNGTGAVAVNSTMPSNQGGDTLTVPYFGTIGDFEDLAADEGGAGALPGLTPKKLTMSTDQASVKHSGLAFEVSTWAELAASYADPYGEAARQMRVSLERKIDEESILTALASPPLTRNVFNATTPVNLDWDLIVDGRGLWGDEDREIAVMVIHSDVRTRLLKEKDQEGRPLYVASTRDGELDRLAGIPVKVSDRRTKETSGSGATALIPRYRTFIAQRGALAFWYNGAAAAMQTDKDILADARLAAIHLYFISHRYSRLRGQTKPGIAVLSHN